MTDLLAPSVQARPEALAAEDGERRWSWAELDRRAADSAARLVRAGARPGRIVALSAHPSLETLAALHGILRTGAVAAPLHPALSPPERATALAALRPTVLVGADGSPTVDAPTSPLASPLADPTPAAILWTSGTSGTPRGVLLSAEGFRANASASRRRLTLGPADVWYASLSPAHVGGLALLLRAAILGSALAVRGRFSVRELDRLLDAGRVTHISLVPTMLLRLLEARARRAAPPSLRCVLVGGARTPPDLVERALTAGYPIALTYGLTEATSQVATASPAMVRADPESVGPPLDGVEVRIDGTGEILVRGPTVAMGILAQGPATDPEGWLHTGDLGILDDKGHLRVTGRRSDRIVSGGVAVDVHEVASAIRAHPAVADACVVGLPDPEWGERVVAAVRPSSPAPMTAAQLHGWLGDRLSPPKRPKEYRFVQELPLNANGKVDRGAVRRLFELDAP